MIRLTIDNKEVLAEEGTTILAAAAQAGIRIPTLCYHEKLQPFGACRICVVEVEQMRGRLTPSCSTPVTEGMVVHTSSEQIIKARRTVLELLLIHHPLDCPWCDKAGECQLQNLTYEYGVTGNRFQDSKSNSAADYVSPLVERNTNRCVLCGMCVRVCDEVVGASELSMVNRGIRTKIATDFDRPLNCEFCGECENICPVGALTNRLFKYKARAWEAENTSTICSFCSTGCAIKLSIKDGRIVRARGDENGAANQGSLCIKGRFGYEYVMSGERIREPLLRKDGKLVPATWEEALRAVAEGLRAVKDQAGPAAIAGLCSARLTNEEAYLFQKLLRAAIGTNNVDNSGGYSHRGYSSGPGMPPPAFHDLQNCDRILVIRSNVSETHPVVGYQVTIAAKKNGAQLIVADPRRIKLARFARTYLAHKPETEIVLLNGMVRVILEEGLEDRDFVAAGTSGIEELKKHLAQFTPVFVEQVTGVAGSEVAEAARLFASGKRAAIIISAGMGFTGDDAALARAAANLALITGNAEKPGAGVLFLGEKSNSHGIVDMGAVPDMLPGAQPLSDDAVRQAFAGAWGAALSSQPGLTADQIMDAAGQGTIKALYCAGENPLQAYPETNRIKAALGKLQFLVVQELFLTPTAQLAHVVLPAASFAEKDGTYTNAESRVQRLHRALPPCAGTKTDAEIFCSIAKALGKDLGTGEPAVVMAEIAGLCPRYQAVSYDTLTAAGHRLTHAGTEQKQGQERAARYPLVPVDFHAPAVPPAEFPFALLIGATLFHCGTLSPRSPGICTVYPQALLEINPADARALDIKDRDTVQVSSASGAFTAAARVTARQGAGAVFIPYHFETPAVNALTSTAAPPRVKIEKKN
jgi:formate dehydrogenase major subunit/NADH-quinone oxidoreductase subunit G